MSDVAIRIENLGKKYRIGANQARYQTLRESLTGSFSSIFKKRNGAHNEDNTIWALKDIDLEVKHGEVLGIIGRNGAGKSTLLKILARITKPTTGRVELNGRVGSLLEVGTGFHPELTGRENIYLSGAILGMHRQEINRKFDEIVAFSEIDKFLDTQVKHYSSGMYMRLAFAVAAHLEPEILLVDEVLAVGDAEFQKKCLGKMGDVAHEGRTVLFVSHNMAAIQNLSTSSILLNQGSILSKGKTNKIIDKYLSNLKSSDNSSMSLLTEGKRSGTGSVKLSGFRIENAKGIPIDFIQSGEEVNFVFLYQKADLSNEPLKNVDIGFSIHELSSSSPLFVLYSSYMGTSFQIRSGNGEIQCNLKTFPIAAGRYRLGARITINGIESDWPQMGIGHINVVESDFYGTGQIGFGSTAPLLISGKWSLEK